MDAIPRCADQHRSRRLALPATAVDRAEVLAHPSPVPREAGFYGWFFRSIPHGVPVDRCIRGDGLPLLYAGIAPKPPPSSAGTPSTQTLRHRIARHYRGNAAGSTLRLTLGCLLAEVLARHRASPGRQRQANDLPLRRGDPVELDGEQRASCVGAASHTLDDREATDCDVVVATTVRTTAGCRRSDARRELAPASSRSALEETAEGARSRSPSLATRMQRNDRDTCYIRTALTDHD